MKSLFYRFIACSLVLFSAFSLSLAEEEKGNVTPYGDYSRECTIYGFGKEPIPPHAAIHALEKYYKEKGYTVGNIVQQGRFLAAEILKDKKEVDRIIFDRRTGRMRSIY